MTTTRLYGRTHDWSSQSMVTRGVHAALGDRCVGVVELHVDYDMEDVPSPRGSLAQAAVFTGPPSLVARMGQQHARRVAFLVPNSSYVPVPLLRAMAASATVVATPSGWAKDVLDEAFEIAGIRMPVAVVPHGVFAVPPVQVNTYAAERLEQRLMERWPTAFLPDALLHWSTSAHQRKGTRELLEAWGILAERGKLAGSKLVLILDPEARSAVTGLMLRLRRGALAAEHTIMVERGIGQLGGLDPHSMRGVLQLVGGVVQPSRGEGFGIVPLEARAAGCPVLTTACTGHSEHLASIAGEAAAHGVVIVESHADGPIDDGPAALAPTLRVDELVAALEGFISERRTLAARSRERAREVELAWSWEKASSGIIPLVEGT